MSPADSRPNDRAISVVFLVVGAAIAAAMIYAHRAAAFTLPVPWGDEAYFVWQARAFERGNTFIAPELDATRPLFLLPFLHGLTMGVAFKIVGYSLAVARAVSLAFTLTGLVMLAGVVRRQAAPIASLVLIGAFMLNPHFVAMANNARMEAMFFAAICASLLLMYRGRHWFGVAVLSGTPMIHPNGVYFLLPVIAYGVLSSDLRGVRPDRAALVMFAVSAAAWLGNGLYALAYWDGFMHETAMRFGETAEKHGGFSQFGGWHAAGLALIAGTFLIARRFSPRVTYLPVFAVGAWLCSRVRIEQWYEVFGDFAYLLVSLALVQLLADRLATSASLRGNRMRPLLVNGAAVGLLAIHYVNGRVQGPRNYVEELGVNGMRVGPPLAYFRLEDHQAIRKQFDELRPGCRASVEVYPWGDALLFADLAEDRIRIQVPYFDEMFQPKERWVWGYGPTPAALPDLYLVRKSRYQPRWLKDRDERFLARALAKSGVDKPTVIHSRDETEVWYVIRPAGDSTKTKAAGAC